MRLVLGLGNPGEKYARTRHNVGFMVIDKISETLKVSSHVEKKLSSLVFYHSPSQTVFAKPLTFMNDSGKSAKKLIAHFKVKLPNLWVIHDDLDLALGSFKIQKGKGPREHKGLLSIYEEFKTKNFWHVRIGVDNRLKELRIPGEVYVLQDFETKELLVIDKLSSEIVNKVLTPSLTHQ